MKPQKACSPSRCPPFLPDGAVDFDSIDRIVDAYIENGANGLTILGMMGETGKRSEEEFVAVFKRVNARNSVPVVVIMTALSNAAMDVGVAGMMAAPPSSLRTDALFINDYENTADAPGSAPFVLQDFPLATGVIISPDVILEIVADCPTCVMFKHENSPGLEKSVHCAQPRTRARSVSRSYVAMAGCILSGRDAAQGRRGHAGLWLS